MGIVPPLPSMPYGSGKNERVKSRERFDVKYYAKIVKDYKYKICNICIFVAVSDPDFFLAPERRSILYKKTYLDPYRILAEL